MITLKAPPQLDPTKYGLKAGTETAWKRFAASMSRDMPSRSVLAMISTDTVDDDGEIVVPEGIDVTRFKKSGTVFWNHEYDKPCGTCVGLKHHSNGLEAVTKFPERPAGHTGVWLADDVWALMSSDPPVVKAFSIGFAYMQTRKATTKDYDRYGTDSIGRIVSKSRMLEYSVAPLPVNEDALVVAVQKGVVSRSRVKRIFGVDPGPAKRKAAIVVPGLKHTPGGHEHDQQSHGNRDGAAGAVPSATAAKLKREYAREEEEAMQRVSGILADTDEATREEFLTSMARPPRGGDPESRAFDDGSLLAAESVNANRGGDAIREAVLPLEDIRVDIQGRAERAAGLDQVPDRAVLDLDVATSADFLDRVWPEWRKWRNRPVVSGGSVGFAPLGKGGFSRGVAIKRVVTVPRVVGVPKVRDKQAEVRAAIRHGLDWMRGRVYF